MFRLHPVILGTDADGETITSCVVETARGTPSKAKRPLTGAALIELNQLRNCMAQSVTDIPSSTHVPNGAKGVLVQLWKDYLIQAKTINEDGNPREEFKRIYVTLQERRYMEFGVIMSGWLPHCHTVTCCHILCHIACNVTRSELSHVSHTL